jgi:hypothetical protein
MERIANEEQEQEQEQGGPPPAPRGGTEDGRRKQGRRTKGLRDVSGGWTVRSVRSPGEILARLRERPGLVDERAGVFRVGPRRGPILGGRVRGLPCGTEIVLRFEPTGFTRRDAAGWALLASGWAVALLGLLPSAAVPATSKGLLIGSAGALTAWALALRILIAWRARRNRSRLRWEVEELLT